MAYVISFSIFKGGTGKTTSTVNTAAALASLGKRVLLVDLDQQASSTRYVPEFGVKGEREEGGAREAKDEEQASWADGYKL